MSFQASSFRHGSAALGRRLKNPIAGAMLALSAFAITTSGAHAQTAIRVGAPLPLTGALSPEGLKLQQGYDLWKDTVNAGGGISVAGQENAGQDRLLRLSVRDAARGAARREADHR